MILKKLNKYKHLIKFDKTFLSIVVAEILLFWMKKKCIPVELALDPTPKQYYVHYTQKAKKRNAEC